LFPLDLDLDVASRAGYQTADPLSHHPFIDDADRKAIAALPKDKFCESRTGLGLEKMAPCGAI
jgi:hypothetical protein